jgi:hypothetical protein
MSIFNNLFNKAPKTVSTVFQTTDTALAARISEIRSLNPQLPALDANITQEGLAEWVKSLIAQDSVREGVSNFEYMTLDAKIRKVDKSVWWAIFFIAVDLGLLWFVLRIVDQEQTETRDEMFRVRNQVFKNSIEEGIDKLKKQI